MSYFEYCMKRLKKSRTIFLIRYPCPKCDEQAGVDSVTCTCRKCGYVDGDYKEMKKRFEEGKDGNTNKNG